MKMLVDAEVECEVMIAQLRGHAPRAKAMAVKAIWQSPEPPPFADLSHSTSEWLRHKLRNDWFSAEAIQYCASTPSAGMHRCLGS